MTDGGHFHIQTWNLKKKVFLKDIDRELDRVCSFLGVRPTEEERRQVIGGVGFDAMKKNSMANYSTFEAMDFKISPFMRKGWCGHLYGEWSLMSSSLHIHLLPMSPSLFLQGKLAIGRIISLCIRMKCLTKSTRRKWGTPHFVSGQRFRLVSIT